MKFHAAVLVGTLALALAVAPRACPAQSLDLFAGLNALTAQQAVQNIPQLGGGLFPSVGANLLFGPVGIGAEVAGRVTRNSSGIRPVYYDVDLLLDPIHISRSIVPIFMFGVGAQNIASYTGLTTCGGVGSCTSYVGSHLSAHVGLDLKVYLTEHLFIQPEAHFYFIRNNQQFQASSAQRFGVSLGWSFGGG
jgi:hypothetical protein